MTQQTSPSEIARIFDAEARIDEEAGGRLEPRYNVAPTDPLTVVLERPLDGRVVEQHRWGLIPAFATSAKDAARRINARAETVASGPAFRASFRTRRCIVPSDGFYEWRRAGTARQPFLLRPPSGAVLAMAGLWAVWKDPTTGLWVPSATVVTTSANRLVSSIHDRMPVLLPREAWDDWLDTNVDDVGYLVSLLVPAQDEVLEMVPVSTKVNSVRNDGPELVVPVGAAIAEPLTLSLDA